MSETRTRQSPPTPVPAPEPAPPGLAGSAETHMPAGVREAAQSADDMIRALSGANVGAGQGAATGSTPPAGGQATVGTPPSGAEAGGAGMQPQPGPDAPAAPPGEAPAGGASDTEVVAALRRQISALEQEARTWRGRHDTELPRERAARQAAEARLEAMETQLAEIQRAPPPAPVGSPLSQDEMDQYGADLFAMIERHMAPHIAQQARAIAQNLVEQRLGGFEDRFKNLDTEVSQVRQSTAKTEAEKFFERLGKKMPNWRDVDNDPAFIAWTAETDPMWGVSRKSALDSAVNALDDERVFKVLDAFLSQSGASGSRGPGTTERNQAPGTGEYPTAQAPAPAPNSLESFAAPGRPTGSQGNESAPPSPRIWSAADIAQHYHERQHGTLRMNPAEADRIDREIAAAQREGRVR